ncbi:MAG TPA: DUF72 domain-containing protein [Kofleriaceae bacterium]|nr:DUF72 domain-containing protein [Kofleriaceae bacterium]
MPRAYIGTSGWVYPGWREHLYRDTPIKRWLEVASRTFSALEINGSFYTQIKRETYARWRDTTPPEFRFALKGHRFVTHYKRLRGAQASIERLRDQASALGDKLAAVVWQLPSSLPCDLGRLDELLRALGVWPVRHALEMRHRSWFSEEVSARLRAAGVAVCLSDAPDFPMWREVTTDLVYVRLHGHTRKYASSYHPASLRRWADDVAGWLAEGRDVHVYFDNDAEGHAVHNALALIDLVAERTGIPAPLNAGSSPSSGSSRSARSSGSSGRSGREAGSSRAADRAAARSARRASGSARAAPSRPQSAPRRAPAWSGRRTTART